MLLDEIKKFSREKNIKFDFDYDLKKIIGLTLAVRQKSIINPSRFQI